jgi:hypothetical protein
MAIEENPDIFSGIAVNENRKFELFGSEHPVSLRFGSEASFILLALLFYKESFTATEIIRDRGFEEACTETSATTSFHQQISHLQSTFDALGSTLIQRNCGETGFAHTYQRNPDYEIVDNRQNQI